MHYFTHGPNIAAVEDVAQAAKYVCAGWRVVSRDTFIAAWRARDMQALADMGPELLTAPLATPQPGMIIERLPNGYVRYSV
jgi:hypothetical protein